MASNFSNNVSYVACDQATHEPSQHQQDLPDPSHGAQHAFHHTFLAAPPPTPEYSPQGDWPDITHSAQELSNQENWLENSSGIPHIEHDLSDLEDWLDDESTYSECATFAPIFDPADERDLNRRGLLLYPSPEEKKEWEGFCKVSREVLLGLGVEAKDEMKDGNKTWVDVVKEGKTMGRVQKEEQKQDGFELWGALPAELKLSVLDFCADREVLGLSRTSKDMRELTKGMVRNRQNAFEWIPLEQESLATIKYIGYTDERAKELWEVWEAILNSEDPDFLHDILLPPMYDGVNKFADTLNAWDESDDWRGVMKKWGLSKDFQDAIMDPEFADIRLTESLRAWVYGTIRLRLDTLQRIAKVSELRAEQCVEHVHTCTTSTNEASFEVPNVLVCSPESHLQSKRNASETKQSDDEEMTVLYKPIQASQVFDIFCRRKDTQYPLTSENLWYYLHIYYDQHDTFPADFANWDDNMAAFYSSELLASKFARYSARRSRGHSPATVIKMSIPTRALRTNLSIMVLNDEQMWRKVVWENRVEKDSDEQAFVVDPTPPILHPTLDVLIGQISCNKGGAMGKKESWEELSAENVLMVDEGNGMAPAMQYFFWGEYWPNKIGVSIHVERVDV